MQLMIDLTAANDPVMLRRVAALLISAAAGTGPTIAEVPSGTSAIEIPAPPAPAPFIPAPPVLAAAAVFAVPSPADAAAAARIAAGGAGQGPTSFEATAPVVIPPPPPPAPVAVDANAPLDKRGFPYDARIHATNAEKTGTINKSDGLWRTKRGVDNALIESVEAELKEIGYGVAVPPAPVIPAPPPVIPPPPSTNVPAPPPVIPPPPSVGSGAAGGSASVPSSDGAGQVDQFRVLMNTIGGHTGPDGKCRREIMAPIYERLLGKAGGLPDFHKARDKIPELLVEVKRLLA